jgi:hypothetical protein
VDVTLASWLSRNVHLLKETGVSRARQIHNVMFAKAAEVNIGKAEKRRQEEAPAKEAERAEVRLANKEKHIPKQPRCLQDDRTSAAYQTFKILDILRPLLDATGKPAAREQKWQEEKVVKENAEKGTRNGYFKQRSLRKAKEEEEESRLVIAKFSAFSKCPYMQSLRRSSENNPLLNDVDILLQIPVKDCKRRLARFYPRRGPRGSNVLFFKKIHMDCALRVMVI